MSLQLIFTPFWQKGCIYNIPYSDKNYNQKDGWPFTNFTGESKSMPERLTALLIFMSINNYTSTPSLSFLKNKTSPSLLIKCICE